MDEADVDSSGDAVSRFPLELWAEEFESRFGSRCQARILHMVCLGKQVSLGLLMRDLQEDMEALLTTAPARFARAFRARSRVVARRMLIRVR